jgi:hypothetical protein
MNRVTDDTFVYFTILGNTQSWVIYLFALVLAHKCLVTLMHFARRTLTWIFDLNYAIEVSRSAITWMINLQDLFKTITTSCASTVLSMIIKVQGHMNSFNHVYEQALVCLSHSIILNQRGIMNCGKLVWMSYVNGTSYYEIEKFSTFLYCAEKQGTFFTVFVFSNLLSCYAWGKSQRCRNPGD